MINDKKCAQISHDVHRPHFPIFFQKIYGLGGISCKDMYVKKCKLSSV